MVGLNEKINCGIGEIFKKICFATDSVFGYNTAKLIIFFLSLGNIFSRKMRDRYIVSGL